MKKITVSLLTITLAIIILAACATPLYAAEPATESITLNKTSAIVPLNGSITLKVASVTPDGASKNVKWSSSNKRIATVSAKGKVSGIKKGKATITAKASSGAKARCKVTVKKTAMSYNPAKGTYTANKSSVYGSKLNQKELNSLKAQVNKVIKKVIKPGMKDYQKFNAVVKWLTHKTTYQDWEVNKYNNTAYGPIMRGRGACSGYARALKALCDGAKIPCYYVHATDAAHQWNMVRLDGIWFHVDAQAYDYASGMASGGVNCIPGMSYAYFKYDKSLPPTYYDMFFVEGDPEIPELVRARDGKSFTFEDAPRY